jgi:hypothetical protein
MKKYLELVFVGLISVGLTLSAVSVSKKQDAECYSCSTEEITNMYAGYVDEWKKEIGNAFDEAEVKVFNVKPTPDVVGPDPDPAKCICKGTGVIVQGDGHKTVCPYHGSKFGKDVIVRPLITLEE